MLAGLIALATSGGGARLRAHITTTAAGPSSAASTFRSVKDRWRPSSAHRAAMATSAGAIHIRGTSQKMGGSSARVPTAARA